MTPRHDLIEHTAPGRAVAADCRALRSYLYAPGHDLDRCRRALQSCADAALIDLEDSVPARDKAAARRSLDRLLTGPKGQVQEIHVRINRSGAGFDLDDLRVAVRPQVSAIRLPKVESVSALTDCAAVLDELTAAAGMTTGEIRLYATIESAAGLSAAVQGELATPHVTQLVFATGDLLGELGFLAALRDGEPTLVARSQLVMASQVMALSPPVDGVYARLDDLDGLRRATHWAADLGFFGKSAGTEDQAAVVNDVYTPSEHAVQHAHRILDSDQAHAGERACARRTIAVSAQYAAWTHDHR